jgi:putative flippase GtrA
MPHKRCILKKLLIQGIHFIGLSGIGWILDFFVYTGLNLISADLVKNNVISSWVGVTFVFFFATRKVFQNHSKIPLKYKYLVYIFYQCILIFFISKLLGVINTVIVKNFEIALILSFSSLLSKILVTPITMILNFFVMKGIVEKL